MKTKPIPFSAPMIRALLDGRKSQTRRVLRWQPGDLDRPFQMEDGSWHVTDSQGGHMSPLGVPYTPGRLLWVREGLQMGFDARTPICHATYASDGADLDLTPEGAVQWAETRKRNTIPSIHMPRWASRITLEVTEVRVQRVQDISADDAAAEGIRYEAGSYELEWFTPKDREAKRIRDFRDLWNSIHGPAPGLKIHGYASSPSGSTTRTSTPCWRKGKPHEHD